jgi:hypothetical protein
MPPSICLSVPRRPALTQAGLPKRRFSYREKLDLLGCTDAHLTAFLELFAPKRKDYIITRAKSGDPKSWTKGHGLLNPALLARHLLGDSLPPLNAQWVGARGAKTTYWFCLDLDNHAHDTDDLHRRRHSCLLALSHIGVTDAHVLTVPTPSQGLHLYVFFDCPIYTDTIEPTLTQIGITHTPGQVEIYPNPARALRLPYGYCPLATPADQPHISWTQLVESLLPHLFDDGNSLSPNVSSPVIATLNWREAQALARNYAVLHSTAPTNPKSPPRNRRSPHTLPSASTYAVLGQPRKAQVTPANTARYQELLNQPTSSPQDVEELLALGILLPGTRLQCLKKIAWHLVFVRHLPADEATQFLSAWAYAHGDQSKDIKQDLANHTTKVHDQIVELITWLHEQKAQRSPPSSTATTDNPASSSRTATFAPEDLHAIRTATQSVPSWQRFDFARFLLYLLNFAKLHGKPTPDGYEVTVSVSSVLRKFPASSGSKYRTYLDHFIRNNVIRLLKEKVQTNNHTGRPRTYFLAIAPAPQSSAMLDFDTALNLLNPRPTNTAKKSTSGYKPGGETFVPTTPETGTTHDDRDHQRTRPQNLQHPGPELSEADRKVLTKPAKELTAEELLRKSQLLYGHPLSRPTTATTRQQRSQPWRRRPLGNGAHFPSANPDYQPLTNGNDKVNGQQLRSRESAGDVGQQTGDRRPQNLSGPGPHRPLLAGDEAPANVTGPADGLPGGQGRTDRHARHHRNQRRRFWLSSIFAEHILPGRSGPTLGPGPLTTQRLHQGPPFRGAGSPEEGTPHPRNGEAPGRRHPRHPRPGGTATSLRGHGSYGKGIPPRSQAINFYRQVIANPKEPTVNRIKAQTRLDKLLGLEAPQRHILFPGTESPPFEPALQRRALQNPLILEKAAELDELLAQEAGRPVTPLLEQQPVLATSPSYTDGPES